MIGPEEVSKPFPRKFAPPCAEVRVLKLNASAIDIRLCNIWESEVEGDISLLNNEFCETIVLKLRTDV